MGGANAPRGRPPHPDVLTPAEWRVLELVRGGLSNAEIADRLGITVHTVKFHVSNMLAKLAVRNRDELAGWEATKSDRGLSRLSAILGAFQFGGAKAAATVAVVGVGLGAGTILLALARGGDYDPKPEAQSSQAATPLADITPTLAVTSFRLVQRELHDIDTGGPSSGLREQERVIAFRAPDERAEVTNHIRPDQQVIQSLQRGTKRWHWPAAGDGVTEINTASFGISSAAALGQAGWPYQPPTLGHLVGQMMAGQGVQTAGTSTVAGRRVMELFVAPNKCFTGGFEDVQGERRMWVDMETLFVLKFEQRGLDGEVHTGWEVSEVEYNTTLPDAIFALPAGKTISVLIFEGTPAAPTPAPTPSVTPTPRTDGCTSPSDEGLSFVVRGVQSRLATATPTTP